MTKFLQSDRRYSPVKVIIRFFELQQKYGVDRVFGDSRLKEAREAYITALATLAWSKQTQKEYWITTPDRDPPDALVVWYERYPKGRLEMHQKIEVVEWQNHSRHADIVAAIRSKLALKRYEPRTLLLVFVHDRQADFKLQRVAQDLRVHDFGTVQIWILAAMEKEGETWEAVTCVYPTVLRILFKVEEELDRFVHQKAVLIPENGAGHEIRFFGNRTEPLP